VLKSPVSSPAAVAALAHLGTPVSQACLTVTLTADKGAAGPRTLVVTIFDESGAPVTDAEVMIGTRHLEMDHGTSTAQAKLIEPGRYAVEQVPMGMSGEWEAEIVISRPGQTPITLIFVVELEGPA
jgi:nitrogen fixation protein FixH